MLQRFDLHLHGPAKILVLHVQGRQRFPAQRPHRSQVVKVVAPQKSDQAGCQPIAEALLRGKCLRRGRLPIRQAEVATVLQKRCQQIRQPSMVVAAVGIGESDKRGRVALQMGQAGEAGLAIAGTLLANHLGSQAASHFAAAIARTVVDHDHPVDQRRNVAQHLREGFSFVTGRNNQSNGAIGGHDGITMLKE